MASTSKRAGGDGTPKAEIYLQLVETREHGYYHLYGRFVTQRFEDHQWVPQGVDDTYSDGLLWSGLRTSCQGDDQSRVRPAEAGEQGPVYGWDCEYHDVYSVDLRRVRRMGKTLERLERGIAKLRETRGYPRSYGEYVGRVAEVMGAKGIVVQTSSRYNALRWDWMSVGDGVNRANHLIWQWVEAGKPQPLQLEAAGETEQAS